MSEPLQDIQPLAPWGSPPTPLLPRWYQETMPTLKLPAELRTEPIIKTVKDLNLFWRHTQNPISKATMRALFGFIYSNSIPPPDLIIIPAEIDHSEINTYPLKIRTIKVLRRAKLLEDNEAISVGQLLSLTNFGRISLIDLMCVTESALKARASLSVDKPNPEVDLTSDPTLKVQITQEQNELIETLLPLLAAAKEFHGAITVTDAFKLDLVKLASSVGIAPHLNSLVISDLTCDYRITTSICQKLESLVESMSQTERMIIESRLVRDNHTLEELGQLTGVTRERIRQLQMKVQKEIEEAVGSEITIISSILKDTIGPVASTTEFDHSVASVFDNNILQEPGSDLAYQMVEKKLSYSKHNDMHLSSSALEATEILQKAANKLADDVGLIDEEALQTYLPNDEWIKFFPALIRCCGFYRFSGKLALRDNARSRVKAALLEIGRTATKEEIATKAGLDPKRVGGHLSAILSIARADKTRWGIVDWIDDIYDGIPAEIIQRIEEDGGTTTLERLVEELPRLFGVSESSVRSYIGTPQFVQRNGYVSMADASNLTLRDLDDVIHGRTTSGNPYWTFLVEDRYFDGYSLVGFPAELAREFGCTPNGNTRIQIVSPKGCKDLSINWQLASLSGASLGYLSEPLERLEVDSGDRVMLIITNSKTVKLCREKATKPVVNHSDSSESLLERMKNRRKVI